MSIFDPDYETQPSTASRRADTLNTQGVVIKEILAIDGMLGGLLSRHQRSVLVQYEMSLNAQRRFAEEQVYVAKAAEATLAAAQSD